ncbi:MAG TPA: LytTR family DNA-binding domain-containing protein [Opitutaceae bacterium]|jgi:two-component system LytT family response regulator
MSKLKAVIADDEPLARERLCRLLSAEPQIEIVAQVGDGEAAVEALCQHAPDLVFLDIQMPGRDGIGVLDGLPSTLRPAVIFVTAHDKYAVDAFAVGAVDYLLKPFDQDRFRVALARATEFVKARGDIGVDRIAVRTDGKVVFLRAAEIRWVEAADNYVILHLEGRRLMVRETLSALEAKLGTARFVRVNRSALVQIDQVKELHRAQHGDHMVVLRDDTRLPLSRSLRTQLARLITAPCQSESPPTPPS